MVIKDAWLYKTICQLLRSFLKFAPDVALHTEESHPHLSDYIHTIEHAVEDTNFVREHPANFLKTCVALSVALVLCYIIFHALLHAHRFILEKFTGRRKVPLVLCPGDLLPTVEADSLQANRKPNVVKRMNEPVEVCLFYTKSNQGQVTPKVLSPPKPVEQKIEQHPPHHVSISETLVEEKKPTQTQLVSGNSSPQDISLVKAVKRESLLNMRILNSADDASRQLGRHDSERHVEVPDPTRKMSPRPVERGPKKHKRASPAESTARSGSFESMEKRATDASPTPSSSTTTTPSSGQTTMPSNSSGSVGAASSLSSSSVDSSTTNSTQPLATSFTDINVPTDRASGGCDGLDEDIAVTPFGSRQRVRCGKDNDEVVSSPVSTAAKDPPKEKKTNTKVFISGSFVNWELKIPLRRDRYGWVVEIQLPKGHFEYRFLVDRQWAIDEKRQQVLLTRTGQLNHVVHV
ncbi:unnamed protein product, partial [Mesorhabditis spiculigera]